MAAENGAARLAYLAFPAAQLMILSFLRPFRLYVLETNIVPTGLAAFVALPSPR
jgi:hypothetical protein